MPGSAAATTCRSRPRLPTTPSGVRRWPPAASSASPAPLRGIAAAEVAARCASPLFRAGAVSPGATLQPARLALGLRARLRERGVEIFERSPVRALRDAPDGVLASTPGGDRSGAHGGGRDRRRRQGPARAAARPAQHRLLPCRHHRAGAGPDRADRVDRRRVHHRRPLPASTTSAPPRTGASPSAGAADGSRSGRAPAAAPSSTPRRWRGPRRTCARIFPGLAGRRVTHAWGGPIDASPTHLPMVVPLAGGSAFAAAGYTGNGVGPSHMVGRTLASLALGLPTTKRRTSPSSTPRPNGSRQSPSTGSAAKRSAPASMPRRRPSSPVALRTPQLRR